MADVELKDKAKLTNEQVSLNYYYPALESSTNAVKTMTLTQLQNLFDNNLVKNNATIFKADLMTTQDVTPAQMIVGWSVDGVNNATAGHLIFRNSATNKQYNGIWKIQVTGAALRYEKLNTKGTVERSIVMVQYGANGGRKFEVGVFAGEIDVDAIINYYEIYLPAQPLNTTDSPTFASLKTGAYTFTIDETKSLSGKADKTQLLNLPRIIYKQLTNATVANTVAETSLLSGAAASRTIPANTLQAGDYIIVEAMGVMSTNNQSDTAQVKLTFSGIDVLQSSQLQLAGQQLANNLFTNWFAIKVISIGETGSIQCYGRTEIKTGTGISSALMRSITGSPITIDTTQDIVIDETYTWGQANANCTLTMSHVIIRKD